MTKDRSDEEEDREEDSSKYLILLVIIAVLAAAAVVGYMLMSGNGGVPTDGDDGTTDGVDDGTTDGGTDGDSDIPSTISSVDVTASGYEGAELTGSYRVRARTLGEDDFDWRIDVLDENQTYIYNSDQGALYLTTEEGTWTKATGSLAESSGKDAFESLVTTAESWAETYGEGEQTITYDGDSVTVDIEYNVSFSDDVFLPPEDADV